MLSIINVAVVVTVVVIGLSTLISVTFVRQRRQNHDKAFRGLKAVPGFDDAKQQELGTGVDIIFVHGLGSDPVSSWSIVPKAKADDARTIDSNNQSINWVEDLLAQDLKKWGLDFHKSIRAYYYGYMSDWMVDAPVVTVSSLAKGLLAAVSAPRTSEPASKDRRIIFVAHSHGGLVVKQALISDALKKGAAGVYPRTAGVLFFGTPHGGSDLTGLGRVVAMILSAWGSDADILEFVKPGSNTNWDLQGSFTDVLEQSKDRSHGSIYVRNFYEELPTPILFGLPPRLVVKRESATFAYSDCENIPLQRNHRELNKFIDRNTDYLIVLKAITTCIEQAGKFTASDQDIEDCKRSLCFLDIDARRHNIKIAHENTCYWLFNNPKFQQWQDRCDLPSHNGVFWIKGKPGAGKSTLMKHTWSYYKQQGTNHTLVAYFFNARGSQLEKSPLGMLRSVLYQLLEQDRSLCERFIPKFLDKQKKHGKEWNWHLGELEEFLLLEMRHYQLKPIIILIDALDECNEQDVREVVSFLESLSISAVDSISLHVCLSSRHYPNIDMEKKLELKIDEEEGHDKDIALYIHDKLIYKNEDIKEELIRKANHVFMWVVLVVEMLNKAFNDGDVRAMESKLRELPDDLDVVFSIMIGKDGPDNKRTILMLQWVLFAERLLQPEELFFAVLAGTTTEGLGTWDRSWEPEDAIQRNITSTSKGLVEIRGEGGKKTVQFIHESVNDFLVRHQRLQTLDCTLEQDPIGSSHQRLATCCLSYIMIQGLEPIEPVEPSEDGQQGQIQDLNFEYPFLRYASTSVLYHIEESQREGIVQYALLQLLEQSSNVVKRLTSFHDIFHRDRGDWYGKGAKLLYVVTFHGYSKSVSTLLERGAEVNAQGGRYGNALQAAAWIGNEALVQLLLERGAEVNAQGGRYGNALQAAACIGNEALVQLLLERGAEVNAQGGRYGNALQAAAAWIGNEALVQLLLERGAEVNAQGGEYGNALQAAAAQSGNEALVQLLLERGAEVNAQGGRYGNALQAAAAQSGNEALVQLLLERGAEVNAQGGRYGNALQAAAWIGNEALVQLLLERGAEVNAQGGRYGNALQAAAAQSGNEALVQLLLERGAEVNAQGGEYGNALQAAACIGNEALVQLLLERGAEVNAQGGRYGNALQAAAAQSGNEALVQLLLERGAEVNAQQ